MSGLECRLVFNSWIVSKLERLKCGFGVLWILVFREMFFGVRVGMDG